MKTTDYDEFKNSSEGRFGETRIHVNAVGKTDAYDHSIPTYSNYDTDSRNIADVGVRGYGYSVSDAIYQKGSRGSSKEYFLYYQYLAKKRGK